MHPNYLLASKAVRREFVEGPFMVRQALMKQLSID